MTEVYCHDCGTELFSEDVDKIVANEGSFQGYCEICLHDPESTANSGKVIG